MPTETLLLKMEDQDGVAGALERALGNLDAAEGELVLDFSYVRRIDTRSLLAMENLVRTAGERSITLSLRGVDVGIYKALKLTKLAQRLSFVN